MISKYVKIEGFVNLSNFLDIYAMQLGEGEESTAYFGRVS
jgi:hypothetical protein